MEEYLLLQIFITLLMKPMQVTMKSHIISGNDAKSGAWIKI